jgi:hypothetical protein
VYEIQKTALFRRQVVLFAREYAQDINAGETVALRFVDRVEEATRFIQSNPFACSVYQDAKKHPKLQEGEYRKWRIKGFPHSVFFRVEDHTIIVAGVYAQKMNIAVRFPSDLGS